MPEVTKTFTDESGTFQGLFWNDGSGNLKPIHHLDPTQLASLVASVLKFQSEDGTTVLAVSSTNRLPVDAQVAPGGPTSVGDGEDVAQGSVGDEPYTGTGNATLISLGKTVADAALDDSPVAIYAPEPLSTVLTGSVFARYNSSPTTATSGGLVELQTDSKGSMRVVAQVPGSNSTMAVGSDTATPAAPGGTANKYITVSRNYGMFGGNWLPLKLDAAGSPVVVGGVLNDGTALALGGTHQTMGGVDGSGNLRPFSVSATGFFHTEGGSPSGATAVGNPFGSAGVYRATPPTLLDGQRSEIMLDERNRVMVALSTSSGSQVSIHTSAGADAQSNTTTVLATRSYQEEWNGATWDRKVKANAVARLASAAASVNATLVKAGPGNVYNLIGYNAAASLRYLKLYNRVIAPVVGTDTPFMTFPLPPTAAFSFSFPGGLYCDTGIGFGFTTAAANSDTGALTAADVTAFNIVYA